MRRLDVARREVNPADYRGKYADERDGPQIVDEPTAVYVDGSDRPSIVYRAMEPRRPRLVAALKGVKFPTSSRTGGMISTSKTFGYSPRNVVHGNEACHAAGMAVTEPGADAELAQMARDIEAIYRLEAAEKYEEHRETVSGVLPDWRIENGVYTSGIVNSSNQLPYHFDRGNFEGVWSNMVTLKRSCIGGDLTLPELGLTIRLADWSLLMFDGATTLHGVTPFRLTRDDGHRFTIVYYSLSQMWHCLPPTEEVAEAAKRRAIRERRRATGGQK